MAKTGTLKDNATGEVIYPTTLVSEIYDSNGNTMVSIFPDKNLSTVTYPIPTAGSTKTGAGDRVIETYVSSDGQTWYRKWASGWKECGIRYSNSSVGLGQSAGNSVDITINLPVTFTNTNYSVSILNQWIASGGHSVIWGSGQQSTKKNNSIVVCPVRVTAHSVVNVACFMYFSGF